MIIAFIVVMTIVMALFFTDTSDPSTWHPRWRSRHRGSHPGGQDQARSKVEEKVPEQPGFFSKVKDTLNIGKHLGFVSDLDSPAAQAALAELREREAREGPQEVVQQAPLSERVKDGVKAVTDAAVEVATGTSGGVLPVNTTSPEEAKSSTEETLSGDPLGNPQLDQSGAGDERQDISGAPVSKDSREQKQKGEKETKHSLSTWALHAARKLGDAVASKDLTNPKP